MAADALIDTSEWWCQHNWALRLIHSKEQCFGKNNGVNQT